jgi:hypothetical protein
MACLDHDLIIIIWTMHMIIITKIMDYNHQSVWITDYGWLK